MKKTLLFGIILLLSLSFAQAIPGIPHQVYGSVTINGNLAPDNTFINAKIDGVTVSSTLTLNGNYGKQPSLFYIQDPDTNRAGKTVELFVNDVKATEFIFVNTAVSNIDLSVTVEDTGSSSGSGSGSGGNSGGSGSGSGGNFGGGDELITTDNTSIMDSNDDSVNNSVIVINPADSCVSDWSCSDWLDCINGKRTRICVDQNSCIVPTDIPEKEITCKLVDSTANNSNLFTGFVTGNKGVSSIVGLLLVAGLIAGLFFVRKTYYKK